MVPRGTGGVFFRRWSGAGRSGSEEHARWILRAEGSLNEALSPDPEGGWLRDWLSALDPVAACGGG